MRRNPIQNNADPRPVKGGNEGAEVIRRTEARGRGKEGSNLIAPGGIEGILGNRKDLYMGIAESLDVPDKALGKLTVREVASVLTTGEGGKMKLVNIDRGRKVPSLFRADRPFSCGKPCAIMPRKAAPLGDDRSTVISAP